MTRSAATTNPVRLLLMLIAMTALTIGLAFASPAAGQFVDDDDDSGSEQSEGQDDGDDEGFVEDEEAEDAPVGGVDAGFGGGLDQDAGLALPAVVALTLLGFAIAGHLAHAGRVVARSVERG
jgi:hypothetical protein